MVSYRLSRNAPSLVVDEQAGMGTSTPFHPDSKLIWVSTDVIRDNPSSVIVDQLGTGAISAGMPSVEPTLGVTNQLGTVGPVSVITIGGQSILDGTQQSIPAWTDQGNMPLGSQATTVGYPPSGIRNDDEVLVRVAGSDQEILISIFSNLRSILPNTEQRLRQLLGLRPGWDGYGGTPPTNRATAVASSLVLLINRLTQGSLEEPLIGPMPDGGYLIEWELDSGNGLMFTINPQGDEISFYLEEQTGFGLTELEGIVPSDATLSELIYRLIGQVGN